MGSAKNIDKQIIEYLPSLNYKQKQTVLTVVKTFIEEKQDWWDEIGSEQQVEIDKSLAEMKAGKVISHDEVMKHLTF